MTRRSPLALAAGVALLVVPLLAAPVGATGGARGQHDRTVAYWTPERIRGAIPRDFVTSNDGRFVPAAKPPGTGGGKPGGGGGSVGGASWTGGGEIVKRSGRVLFTMGGVDYICSASVASDSKSTYSVILTAAHCAYDESAGAFATNWMYIPSFDTAPTYSCASATYGCWTALALVVHSGYATAGGFNQQATIHDFAFAVVGVGGNGNTQLDALGAYPVTTALATGNTLYAFGYPAAGKYKGKDLTYCKGPIFQDPYNANLTWGMTCDMTGGSSGGPWLAGTTNPANGSGSLGSLNSYGYSGVNAMHGPKFNNDTTAVYNAAKNANPDAVGIDGIIVP